MTLKILSIVCVFSGEIIWAAEAVCLIAVIGICKIKILFLNQTLNLVTTNISSFLHLLKFIRIFLIKRFYTLSFNVSSLVII